MNDTNFPPGTRVGTLLLPGIVHEGIATHRCANGEQTVINASQRAGYAIEEPMSMFSGGGFVFKRDPLSHLDPRLVLANAERLLGKPWNLFDANCQHFVAECFGVKPNSPQLWFWAIVLALGISYAGSRGR